MSNILESNDKKIIVFDTETTGLDENSRILQLALLIHMKTEAETFVLCDHETFNPGVRIDFESMATHHITEEDVEGLDRFENTAIYEILSKVNNESNVFVAHNSKFDIDMLKREKIHLRSRIIDTYSVSKHLNTHLKKHNLQYLRYALGLYKKEKEFCEKYNIKSVDAHNALGDVIVTYLLLNYFIEQGQTIKSLIELTNTPIVPEIINFGKYEGKKISDVVKSDRAYIAWCLNKMEKLSEEYRNAFMSALGIK